MNRFTGHVVETDGHSVADLLDALDEATALAGSPTVILARTVKGKGVSFMEGRFEWHGKVLSQEESRKAMQELEG